MSFLKKPRDNARIEETMKWTKIKKNGNAVQSYQIILS